MSARSRYGVAAAAFAAAAIVSKRTHDPAWLPASLAAVAIASGVRAYFLDGNVRDGWKSGRSSRPRAQLVKWRRYAQDGSARGARQVADTA
jgi:hypothetical protein